MTRRRDDDDSRRRPRIANGGLSVDAALMVGMPRRREKGAPRVVLRREAAVRRGLERPVPTTEAGTGLGSLVPRYVHAGLPDAANPHGEGLPGHARGVSHWKAQCGESRTLSLEGGHAEKDGSSWRNYETSLRDPPYSRPSPRGTWSASARPKRHPATVARGESLAAMRGACKVAGTSLTNLRTGALSYDHGWLVCDGRIR